MPYPSDDYLEPAPMDDDTFVEDTWDDDDYYNHSRYDDGLTDPDNEDPDPYDPTEWHPDYATPDSTDALDPEHISQTLSRYLSGFDHDTLAESAALALFKKLDSYISTLRKHNITHREVLNHLTNYIEARERSESA